MIPNALPDSLVDNPRLDQWIAFEAGGKVRLKSGKVEIGQGVQTAMIQIAADELDVDIDQIRITAGRTSGTPNEGFTSGSRSIEAGGMAVRLVAAEVRSLFLEKAAFKLGCKASELTLQQGRILKGGQETGLDYWALSEEVDLARTATGTAPLKRKEERRYIGKPMPRVDLPGKVFATDAPFLHDVAPEGMLHARVLRQPWPGAVLQSIDEDAIARAAKGRAQVVRTGNFVALLSEDETLAVKAVEAAERYTTWTGGTPLQAGQDLASHLPSLPADDRPIDVPKPGYKAGKAETRIEATYTKPYFIHASIGPSVALARCDDGKITVWSHSQGVFQVRAAIAKALGIDLSKIDVLHYHGSGCYGHNPADDAAFDAALIATLMPGKPIRVMWRRADELANDPFQSAMQVKIAAEVDASGKPVSTSLDVWSGTHIHRPGTWGGPNLLGAKALPNPPPPVKIDDMPDGNGGGGPRNSISLYDFPQKIVSHYVADTPVRTSSYRGLGALGNVFAIESFMDELAHAAGQDPVAYRLSLMSDPRACGVIEAVAKMANWQPGAPGGTGAGRGFAFSRYKNRAAYVALVVDVEVEEDVRLKKVWCAADAGLVINPDGLANQLEGGIVFAASNTLKERLRFEDGRVATIDWDTYPILKFSEVPQIEVKILERPDDPPLGAGEVTHGPTAAAIGNAVYHALGVRIRDLPLDRDGIVAALHAAE